MEGAKGSGMREEREAEGTEDGMEEVRIENEVAERMVVVVMVEMEKI